MKKQKIVIELTNPEKWVQELNKLLNSEKINIPSDNELTQWSSTDHSDTIVSNKIVKLFNDFQIRAYHACRPLNVNDYYQYGLKVPDNEMYFYLFDKYIEKLGIKLSNEQYERGKNALIADNLDKNIYFHLLPEDLLNKSGHYLAYGSEKMISAFVKALNSNEAHDFLEDTIGTATIIETSIPIKLLSKYQQKVVCSDTLLCLKNYKDNYKYETSSCIWLDCDIKPEYISSHSHPKEGFNPIKWRTIKFKQ